MGILRLAGVGRRCRAAVRLAASEPKIELAPGLWRCVGWLCGDRSAERGTGCGKPGAAVGVGEKAVVPQADEALRKCVLQETACEFLSGDGQDAHLVLATAIAVTEADMPVGDRDDPRVADGDAVSVTAEIAEHLLRTRHRWLAVDDPWLRGSLAQGSFALVTPCRR